MSLQHLYLLVAAVRAGVGGGRQRPAWEHHIGPVLVPKREVGHVVPRAGFTGDSRTFNCVAVGTGPVGVGAGKLPHNRTPYEA